MKVKKVKKVKKAHLNKPIKQKKQKERALNVKGVKEVKEIKVDNMNGEIKKKRGRPRKIVASTECEEHKEPIITITHKFEGYCPKCKTMIGGIDIKGSKFICVSCGEEGKRKGLLKEVIRNGPKNKKEYLEIYYGSFNNVKKDTIPKEKTKELEPEPEPIEPIEPIDTEDIEILGTDKEKEDIIKPYVVPIKTDEEELLETDFLDPDKEV